MKYIKITTFLLFTFIISCATNVHNHLKKSDVVSTQCSTTLEEYTLIKETYIDFILIREQGKPDKLRLLDYNEANRFLSTITSLFSYIDCILNELPNPNKSIVEQKGI